MCLLVQSIPSGIKLSNIPSSLPCVLEERCRGKLRRKIMHHALVHPMIWHQQTAEKRKRNSHGLANSTRSSAPDNIDPAQSVMQVLLQSPIFLQHVHLRRPHGVRAVLCEELGPHRKQRIDNNANTVAHIAPRTHWHMPASSHELPLRVGPPLSLSCSSYSHSRSDNVSHSHHASGACVCACACPRVCHVDPRVHTIPDL